MFRQFLLTIAACVAASGGTLSHAASTVTRTSTFDYDTATGLLTKEVVEPDDPTLCVVKSYVLDSYGHQQATTVRNCNGQAGSYSGASAESSSPGAPVAFAPRSASNTYTADQRFIATSTNALGHRETKAYDGRFGAAISLTGPTTDIS